MEAPKSKKTSTKKKTAEVVATENSIVSAFGGTDNSPVPGRPATTDGTPTPFPPKKKTSSKKSSTSSETTTPALFIEEIETATITPVPTVSKKQKKPAVVAVVTPDGIQGSLSSLENRALIAHLPIHISDIDNDMFSVSKNESSETTVQPRPYDPNDIFVNYGQQDTTQQVTSNIPQQPVVVSRPTLPLHYSEKLMIRFLDANREQRLPDSTEVACFWDCHPFRGTPCVIPVGIEEGIWRVYGNFCCPECAASYLFQERLDSHVQWERYALLNRLYAGYLGEDRDKTLRLAPPKSILRLFGGTLDISEYRDIIQQKRMRIDVMAPPMISIIQVMDTKPIDFYDASMKNTFIPWEMDRMNRPGAQGLRLRRTKPVMEKGATLEYCMGIAAA